jgi:protein gp37
MAENTSIEWTRSADGTAGATWNPIRARNKETGTVGWFCEHASDGCSHCYAEGFNHRLGTGLPYVRQNRDLVEIFLDQKTLLKPLTWRRPRNIFPCSMTDLFGEFVPDEMRDSVFAVAALASQHTYQILTKRPAEAKRYMLAWPDGSARFHHVAAAAYKIDPALPRVGIEDAWCWRLQERWPLPNIHLGVSIESRRHLGRLDDLRATPAAVRWASFEPLLEYLGQIDLTGIDWIVVGGESGPNARPMHPDWARSLRDQCVAAGVPFFFKQWGEWAPSTPEEAAGNPRSGWQTIRGHPAVARAEELYPEAGAAFMAHVGKKAAGALLDGREWRQMPGDAP